MHRVPTRLKIASPFMLMFQRKESNRLADDFDPNDITAATVFTEHAGKRLGFVDEGILVEHLRNKSVKTAKELDVISRSDVYCSETWVKDQQQIAEAVHDPGSDEELSAVLAAHEPGHEQPFSVVSSAFPAAGQPTQPLILPPLMQEEADGITWRVCDCNASRLPTALVVDPSRAAASSSLSAGQRTPAGVSPVGHQLLLQNSTVSARSDRFAWTSPNHIIAQGAASNDGSTQQDQVLSSLPMVRIPLCDGRVMFQCNTCISIVKYVCCPYIKTNSVKHVQRTWFIFFKNIS